MERLSELADPGIIELASSIRSVLDLSVDEKKEFILMAVEQYAKYNSGKLPPVLGKLFFDDRFRQTLAYSRSFCLFAGIPYHSVDNHWNDMRAGAALFYLEQIERFSAERVL